MCRCSRLEEAARPAGRSKFDRVYYVLPRPDYENFYLASVLMNFLTKHEMLQRIMLFLDPFDNRVNEEIKMKTKTQ